MLTGIKVKKSEKLEEKKYLDVLLLADYIHVSELLIYKMVSNKTIPHHKIVSGILFD